MNGSEPTRADAYMTLTDAAARLGISPEEVVERMLRSPWQDSILFEREAVERLALFGTPSGGGGVVSE